MHQNATSSQRLVNLLLKLLNNAGALAAILIIRFEREGQQNQQSRVLRLIESPIPLALGAMSYSLYLFHWPVLSVVNAAMGDGQPVEDRCWLMLLLGTPFVLIASFASYLTTERPLIRKRHRVTVASFDDFSRHLSAGGVVLVQP